MGIKFRLVLHMNGKIIYGRLFDTKLEAIQAAESHNHISKLNGFECFATYEEASK